MLKLLKAKEDYTAAGTGGVLAAPVKPVSYSARVVGLNGEATPSLDVLSTTLDRSNSPLHATTPQDKRTRRKRPPSQWPTIIVPAGPAPVSTIVPGFWI